MSFYDLATDSVYQNAVGGTAGWVFPNDMKIIGTKGYVTLSGADKVDVIDLEARQVARSIPFPASSGPGFMAVAGETLYVANYDGTVSFIDLRSDTVVATTGPLVRFPGGIACSAGRVFVSDIGLYSDAGKWVKVLSPGNPAASDSVRVENAPGPILEQGGMVMVACTGTSMLYALDPASLALTDSLQLSGYIGDCASDGEHLYVLGSDSVAKVEDNPLTLLSSAVIRRTSGSYFYALSLMRPAGVLYVSTIMSSGGAGRVEAYRTDGTEARPPFPVGIFPGAFAFRQ